VEDWLKYAPAESLALYMYQKPKTAKRLFFDVIPKTVDEYLDFLAKFPAEAPEAQLGNPVWHIHNGHPPIEPTHLSYSILLNLVGVAHAEDPGILWQYISRYTPSATPESAPLLDRMVKHALAYYRDFVKPAKRYKTPSAEEATALKDLRDALAAHAGERSPEALQNLVFEVGKRHAAFANLRDWFKALYQILLGQDQGPRMGSFIALYGAPETIALIDRVLAGESLGGA
jgi:lysyl-tRNA synthetase class 1